MLKTCDNCGYDNRDTARICTSCKTDIADLPTTGGFDTLDIAATKYDIIGRMIANRYDVLKKLGQGGMGEVYKVEDTSIDEIIAIKVLPGHLGNDDRAVKFLKDEVKNTRSLRHENIVGMYNFEETEDFKFVTMEYVEGKNLSKLLLEKGKFNIDELIPYINQICDGLQFAHDRKMLHRDIKPANIILRNDGVIKIADFGIARIIHDTHSHLTGEINSGTLIYMSPEQIKGGKLTPQSDIYSLGIMLYELLSGEPLFKSGDITYQHINVIPKPIVELPEYLNNILMRALSKDPAERFENALELKDALKKRTIEVIDEVKQKPEEPIEEPQKSKYRTENEEEQSGVFIEKPFLDIKSHDQFMEEMNKQPKENNQEFKQNFYKKTEYIGHAVSVLIIISILSYVQYNKVQFQKEIVSAIVLQDHGNLTDIDGNIYKTVKIGEQEWMAENLKVTRYRNGDPIPHVTDFAAWKNLSSGAYSIYDNNENNASTYGYLYNWHAVIDSRNLAPKGWHVPTHEEWKDLFEYLGTDSGGKLKESGTSHWNPPNTGATNESGFTALPGGNYDDGYDSLGSTASFWSSTVRRRNPSSGSSTDRSSTGAWRHELYTENSIHGYFGYTKGGYLSVRLVKDRTGGIKNPLAGFKVSSNTINTNTNAVFDASPSTGDGLIYRWDFDSDGKWDRPAYGYSSSITAVFRYSNSGKYMVKLEVKDSARKTSTSEQKITVSEFSESDVDGTYTDIDGNVYKSVKIGEQEWMAENLKVTRYRNGDAIPNEIDDSEWGSLTTGAFGTYENDESNASVYGYLYNWYAVNNSRGIASEGWHVPTDEDWKELEKYLGMSQPDENTSGKSDIAVGGKLKETSTTHWNRPNEGATNEIGFSALPGGYRSYFDGGYIFLGIYAFFWSSTEEDSDTAWYRYLSYDYSGIYRYTQHMENGFSVRLVRDK